jgi:hypothetical protein
MKNFFLCCKLISNKDEDYSLTSNNIAENNNSILSQNNTNIKNEKETNNKPIKNINEINELTHENSVRNNKNKKLTEQNKIEDNQCNEIKIEKSRNVDINEENNKSLISIITFSNMKVVGNSKQNTYQNFDTEVLNTQELLLTGDIFWNKDVNIDRMGIKSGNRKKNFGNVIFGVGENENFDFILNLNVKDSLLSDKKSCEIFCIEYDKNEEKFDIKVLKKEIKILHLIDYDFYLQNFLNINLYIGKILIEINTFKANEGILTIIVNNEKKYTFNKDEVPITIGRGNSKIIIKNSSISKNHAIIDYSSEYGVFFIRDLGSTNKTFFELSTDGCSSMKLIGYMEFKIIDSKFHIRVIE